MEIFKPSTGAEEAAWRKGAKKDFLKRYQKLSGYESKKGGLEVPSLYSFSVYL